MRKLKKKQVTNQAPKTSGEPVQIYTSPEEQFGLPAATPSVAPLINTGYTDYDLDPFYDNPRIRELRAANDAMLQQSHQDYNEYLWDKKIEDYYDAFAKSKKTDKIRPLESLPIDNLTPELEQELKDQGFFINKTKTEAQLFPGDIIQRRVIDNGFRENQFSNYWGIDAKQVKQQYGDLFKAADQQYEATVLNKVLQESIKQGKSPEEVFDKLPKSWGVTSEMKKKYLKKSQDELTKIVKQADEQMKAAASSTPLSGYEYLFEDNKDPRGTFERTYYTKADGSPDWEKINARSKRMENAANTASSLSGDLEVRNLGNQSDQFSNYGNYYTGIANQQRKNALEAIKSEAAAKPFYEAQSSYVAPIASQILADKFSNQANLAVSEGDYKKQAELLSNLQNNRINQIVSDKELSDEVGNAVFRRQNRDRISASDPLRQDLNWLDKTQDALTYFPDFLKQGTGMWDGESLSYRDRKEIEKSTGIDMGTDKDNLVGDALNTFNPLRLGYESRKNVEAGRYGDLALDLATTFSPFYAGKLAQGLGRAGSKLLNYSPIKAAPWLNLQNTVINPYFAYESVKPGGYFNQAYTDFSKGDIASGIGNTAWGAMGVLPYVKPAKDILGAYKALSTPGGKVAFPTAGNYAFGYRSPQASELFVGNPAIEGAVPAFESITNPLNKFTNAANLGEFRIMKNAPVAQTVENATVASEPLRLTATSAAEAKSLWDQGYRPVVSNAQSRGGKDLTIDNIFNTRKEVVMVKDAPKTLDTEVPMYRVEPEGVTFSSDPLSNEYRDWDYGEVANMSEAELAEAMQDPNAVRWVDNEGVERVSRMFPQHTAGKWWSDKPIGTEGAPDYVSARFSEKRPISLTTRVPFSMRNKFSVKNDPRALDFAGRPENEFILPDEYKINAEKIDYKTGEPIDTGKLGAADDITEVEQLEDAGRFQPINDEIAIQLGDDLRARKIERWQSPEGQRRLQQMIDNTPSLQGLTPNDYIETLAKANSWNRQRNNLTTEIAAAEQELARVKEENSFLYGEMYDSGQSISKEFDAELTAKEELVKQKIDKLKNDLSSLEADFPNSLGYWNPKTQTYAIDPSKMTAKDAKLILAHELAGHTLGSPIDGVGTTYLDDALDKLDLATDEEIATRTLNYDQPKEGQLTIFNETSGAYDSYGPGGFGDKYIDKALDYWKTGSKGTEKVPFAIEAVEDMIQKGLIKSEYDKITPELVQKHFQDYMRNRGNKYPLRIYDILEDKKKNFKILADVMNNLPVIAGTAMAADALMGDDDNKEENVTNAGLLMLFGKFGKPGKAVNNLISKIKSGVGVRNKALIKAANNIIKGGYYTLTNAEKKILDEFVDLEKLRINAVFEGKNLESAAYKTFSGMNMPDKQFLDSLSVLISNQNIINKTYKKILSDYNKNKLDQKTIDNIKSALKHRGALGGFENMSDKELFEEGLKITMRNLPLINLNEGEVTKLIKEINTTSREILDLEEKVRQYRVGVRPFNDGSMGRQPINIPINDLGYELSRLNNKKNLLLDQLGHYKLDGDKIYEDVLSETPWLNKSIKTGDDFITDFTTGQTYSVSTDVGSNRMTYALSKDLQDGDQIAKSMELVPKKMDANQLTALNNNIKFTTEKLPGSILFGSTTLVTGLGVPHLSNDIDVLMIDKDFKKVAGNLDVIGKTSPSSPATQVNIYPDAVGDSGKVDVNLIHTGKDGLAMDDPESGVGVATQIFRQFYPEEFAKESLEAAIEGRDIKIPFTPEQLLERYDPVEKSIMDAYEANPDGWGKKEKHRHRPDVIVSFADETSLDKVASGQLKYIKSIVGPNGQLAKQFPEEAFSDVAKNLQMLNDIKYPGARSIIARSPKRMQLALNDWYIHETTYSRHVDYPVGRSLINKVLNKATPKQKELLLQMFNEWDPIHGGGTVRGIGLNTQKLGPLGHSGNIRGHKQLNITKAFNHPEYVVNMDDPADYISEVKYQSGSGLFTLAETEKLNKIYNETIGKSRGTKDPDDRWVFPFQMIDNGPQKIEIGYANSREEELQYVEFLDRISKELGLRSITSNDEYNGGTYSSTIAKIDEVTDAIMFSAIKDNTLPVVKSWSQRNADVTSYPKPKLSIDTIKKFKKVKSLLESGLDKINGQIEVITGAREAITNQNFELAQKFFAKNKKYADLKNRYRSAEDALAALNGEYEMLMEQHIMLTSKLNDIDKFKKSFRTAVPVIIGSIAAYYGGGKLVEHEEKRRLDFQKRRIKRFRETVVDPAKKQGKLEYINEYLERTYGKDYKKSEEYPGNIFQWDSLRKVYDLGKPVFEKFRNKKFGGEAGIDLELTQEEIDELIKQGYNVVQR